jgi:YD repeat-containing protein
VSRKMCGVLFAVSVLQCVLSAGLLAQIGPCQRMNQYWQGDPPTPGQHGCVIEITFLQICLLQTSGCPPAASKAEIPSPPCLSCAGKPISLATGNTWIEQTDIRVPGLGGGLSLVRTWNSLWPSTQTASQIGLFGPNWRSTFEERVFLGTDYYMKYSRSDGSFWSFGYNNQGTWSVAAPANVAATLVPGSTYWTLTFQNGERKLFSTSSGLLISIIDRNGNTTQVSYDANNRITTVADAASRHLSFTYPNGSSFLVSSVTSDVGLSLSYSYDSQGRLSQVTEPDQSTISFTYNNQSLITLVTDSNGKTLEAHTYDGNGRGLTSSQAGGVNAVSITYP